MEDNFNQNDFEEFLKEQVKNHRMYPADTVWRDINKKLHGDKKWPALTIAAFALLSATIAICIHFTPKPDIFVIKPSNQLRDSASENSQPESVLNNLPSSASLYKEKSLMPVLDQSVGNTAVSPGILIINTTNEVIEQNEIAAAQGRKDKKVIDAPRVKQAVNIPAKKHFIPKIIAPHIALLSKAENKDFGGYVNSPPSINKAITSDTFEETQPVEGNFKTVKDYNDKNVFESFLKGHKNNISLYKTSKTRASRNKLGFQIYLAPSVSYRKLIEDRSMLKEGTITGPVGLNYVTDVNNVVRHKPGNGLEAGVSILYNLTDKFRFKSGLQFNVRQYSIEAYRSGRELASIALIGDHGIDTVNTMAVYRNTNGYYSAELVNRYYQLAIPIGVEWAIIGNKRIQLNVAGSIQPTYLINRNAYILSTNFKNYSENPDMVRSFNINSNIETFISFKAGDFKWQLGPQFRYQPYSTFIRQYPIKEHLMDYGIKIGLSKTFD